MQTYLPRGTTASGFGGYNVATSSRIQEGSYTVTIYTMIR
jgi:hypothetical protein